MDRVRITCPAKVNLALSVGAPAPAGTAHAGMHPIASWMVALQFADELVVERAADGRTSFDIHFADPPSPAAVDWPLEKDLAFRAHGLLQSEARQALPVHLALAKRIPPGAGLAGGSSNAAGTLVALSRLFDLQLSEERLQTLAGRLGSDVVFLVSAILGNPAQIVTGFGDRLAPAPLRQALHLVLIFPPFGCPTGAVYQAFDVLGGNRRRVDEDRVRQLAAAPALAPGDCFNELAEPACQVRPELAVLRRRIADLVGMPVDVSGSGSTLFVIARDEAAATALAERITRETGLPALATATL